MSTTGWHAHHKKADREVGQKENHASLFWKREMRHEPIDNNRSTDERENRPATKTAENLVGILIGYFQMQVLSAVGELGQKAYGLNIRDYLEIQLNKTVATPQVYAALSRLTEFGLVTSSIDEQATAGRKGRPRRVYSINSSGLRMLEAGHNFAKPTNFGTGEKRDPKTSGEMVLSP